MSKDLSANITKITKKYYKKKLVKDIKIFLKKKKKRSDNSVVKDTKIYQMKKNKSLLNIEKEIIKWEGTLYYNYNKLFCLCCGHIRYFLVWQNYLWMLLNVTMYAYLNLYCFKSHLLKIWASFQTYSGVCLLCAKTEVSIESHVR